jgi:5-methylcytosine-specific restriction endonuclease McrA
VVQCICTVCGAPFESRTKIAKYCSKPCKWKAEYVARVADGRLAEHRAKNREHRNRYMHTYKLVMVPCSVCGAQVERKTAYKDRQFVCSYDCRGYLRFGKWPSSDIPWQHPIRSTPVPLDHPTRVATSISRARFISGRCSVCGVWITIDVATGGASSNVCGHKCFKRKHRLLRRSRVVSVITEEVHPYKVYERDGWLCYLCGEGLDKRSAVPAPLAPTLDHVVPLVMGGSHTYSNIRSAHFICNCLKRDRPLRVP